MIEEEIKGSLNFSLEEWKNIQKYAKEFRVVSHKGILEIGKRITHLSTKKVLAETPIEEQLKKNASILLLSYYTEIYNSGYRSKILVKTPPKTS